MISSVIVFVIFRDIYDLHLAIYLQNFDMSDLPEQILLELDKTGKVESLKVATQLSVDHQVVSQIENIFLIKLLLFLIENSRSHQKSREPWRCC